MASCPRRRRISGPSAASASTLPQSGKTVVYNGRARTEGGTAMSENATAVALNDQPPAPLRPPNTASAMEEINERADTVWTRDGGKPVKVQVTERRELKGPRGRVAIVDGCRTPFIK